MDRVLQSGGQYTQNTGIWDMLTINVKYILIRATVQTFLVGSTESLICRHMILIGIGDLSQGQGHEGSVSMVSK